MHKSILINRKANTRQNYNKTNNDYWKKYNFNKKNLIKKILKFNDKFKFNFYEKEHFNHTRDILALSLSLFKDNKKIIKVLDFGSNPLTISNLNNKINTKKFKFVIFDPFSNKINNKKINIKNVKYSLVNNLNKIYKSEFEVMHFASSIQYQENFIKNLNRFRLNKTKIIIFTHTPFSLGKTYLSRQTNHTNLIQTVYSLKQLILKLKKIKFNLIFKSRNNDKYIACQNKKFKSFSLNLVFKK